MAGSYSIRVVAEYDLTIEAEDENEAIELAEFRAVYGQEIPDEVNSEVISFKEDKNYGEIWGDIDQD